MGLTKFINENRSQGDGAIRLPLPGKEFGTSIETVQVHFNYHEMHESNYRQMITNPCTINSLNQLRFSSLEVCAMKQGLRIKVGGGGQTSRPDLQA